MNGPIDDPLLRRLERTTAPSASDNAAQETFSEEDAELRECWLAWERLLESTEEDFDEAALLAQVRRAVAETQAAPVRHSLVVRWTLLAGVAATVLAAVLAWRFLAGDAPQVADERSTPEANPATATAPPRIVWEDALDEQFAHLNEQMIYAGADWRGYDAPYAALDQRLQDLVVALEDDPL